MSEKRFDKIIKQRNHEMLLKTIEYYRSSEHQKELSIEHWKALKETLEMSVKDPEHELIVYAPQYFILLPEYVKAIQKPIFQGLEVDDLFYFFDVDYVLDTMDDIPTPQPQQAPDEIVKYALMPLYAKYMAMTAAGMTTATDFDTPALDQQIKKELQRDKYNGLFLTDLINLANNEPADIKETLLYKAVEAALLAIEKSGAETSTVKRTDKVEYPLDKINNKVWRLLEEDTQGQLTFAMEKKGSRKPISLVYSIDFEELEGKAFQLSKRLTSFDKRCYIAIASLYNAGNTDVISLTQIHYCMGNKNPPSPAQMQRLRTSIEKMAAARVTIVNPDDYKKYGSFTVRGRYLLAANTDGTYNIQGALTKGGISLLEEPILMQFAKKRDQLTTVPLKLLQSPINKTDTNLAIDDYLIERIRRAKRTGSKNTKILFPSLCESLNITEKKPHRILSTVGRYLDYYASCGEITGYKISDKDNSISIRLKD